jgi:hypothetical protein
MADAVWKDGVRASLRQAPPPGFAVLPRAFGAREKFLPPSRSDGGVRRRGEGVFDARSTLS